MLDQHRFVQAWVTGLLVMSSILMHQQYVLSKVFLDAKTRNTRLCTD